MQAFYSKMIHHRHISPRPIVCQRRKSKKNTSPTPYTPGLCLIIFIGIPTILVFSIVEFACKGSEFLYKNLKYTFGRFKNKLSKKYIIMPLNE